MGGDVVSYVSQTHYFSSFRFFAGGASSDDSTNGRTNSSVSFGAYTKSSELAYHQTIVEVGFVHRDGLSVFTAMVVVFLLRRTHASF